MNYISMKLLLKKKYINWKKCKGIITPEFPKFLSPQVQHLLIRNATPASELGLFLGIYGQEAKNKINSVFLVTSK